MIKAHSGDYNAERFGEQEWVGPNDLRFPWRSCSYCCCIHPEDLVQYVRNGATLSGADWKYGWPHKFYLTVENPVKSPEFYVGSENGVDKYGTLLTLTGKWYNLHLKDDDVPEELWDMLAEHTRIRFKRVDSETLAYVAPYAGFQMYKGLDPIPPIPDWPNKNDK